MQFARRVLPHQPGNEAYFFVARFLFQATNNPHAQGETMINDQEQVISNEVSIEEAEERESKDSLKTLKLDVRSLSSVTGTG